MNKNIEEIFKNGYNNIIDFNKLNIEFKNKKNFKDIKILLAFLRKNGVWEHKKLSIIFENKKKQLCLGKLNLASENIKTIEVFEEPVDLYFSIAFNLFEDMFLNKENKTVNSKEYDLTNIKYNKCPDYYKLKIGDNIIEINDISNALEKKIKENNNNYSYLKFKFLTQALEYILRSPFKGQENTDLEKAIDNLSKIIEYNKNNI